MDFDRYQYRTELHLHTSPASGCSEIPPEKAVEIYAGLGYHSIVICNHFYPGMRFREDKEQCLSAYLDDYDRAVEAGKQHGVNVILGCEIRLADTANDYLLFGFEREDLCGFFDLLDSDIETFSKQFRRPGRLLIQAHPFRNGMTEVPTELLDGMETFNMHPSHNSRVAVASLYAKKHGLLPIAGTDYHHPGHQGMAAIRTQKPLCNTHDIVEVLKNGEYLMEIGGCIVLPLA